MLQRMTTQQNVAVNNAAATKPLRVCAARVGARGAVLRGALRA